MTEKMARQYFKAVVTFLLLMIEVSLEQDSDFYDKCVLASRRVLNEFQAAIVPSPITNVTTYVVISQIGNVNAARDTFDATMVVTLQWDDPRLAFDDTGCSIPVTVNRIDSIWYPPFIVSNAATAVDHGAMKDRSALVMPNGHVKWRLPMSLSVMCKYEVDQFPYDKQTCFISMHSTIYFNSKFLMGMKTKTFCKGDPMAMAGVDFIPSPYGSFQFISNDVIDMPLWRVTGACSYVLPGDLVSNIYNTFHMERKPSFYIPALFIPMLIVSAVQAAMFSDELSGEKVSIPITALLAYFFLIAAVSQEIPPSSDNMPYVMYLLIFLLFDGATATLTAALICNVGESLPNPRSPEARAKLHRMNAIAISIYTAVTTGAYIAYFVCVKYALAAKAGSDIGCVPKLVVTTNYEQQT